MKRVIRFVDLCAGLGGFHLAFSRLNGWYRSPGECLAFECVFASELDPELRSLYVQNFPGIHESYRDWFPFEATSELIASICDDTAAEALTIHSEAGELEAIHGDLRAFIDPITDGLRRYPSGEPIIPEHDLLCAGFPCQPFSKSGTQRGFADTRGTVFHLIAAVIEGRRPSLVFLENVGNFERHDGGNTWRRVEQVLKDLGYEVSATLHKKGNGSRARGLLSPHDIGLPHHRQRFFIVAKRKDVTWLPPMGIQSAFPSVDDGAFGTGQGSREQQASAALGRIVATSWKNETSQELEAAQISPDRVMAIDHWNRFLSLLKQDDAAGRSPSWRSAMPSFPIWGYELDPWQWYPIERNPGDFIDRPGDLSRMRDSLIEEAADQVRATTDGTVDLLAYPPTGARAFLAERCLTGDAVRRWIETWPGYAGKREKWPKWKVRFLKQNRAWALALWSHIPADQLRTWIDDLFRLVPAPSNQKLEWNCKGEELDLWVHILQFRPSGLRVKRFRHVPALVAMTSTQVPIVPRLDPQEPRSVGHPKARGRHLLRSEALQLQGFPSTWGRPRSRDASFKAFGNAVHCELVEAIARTWLGGSAATPEASDLD